jgi:hypothetical protein
VATILIAKITSPIYSATVVPNPITTIPQSPTTGDLYDIEGAPDHPHETPLSPNINSITNQTQHITLNDTESSQNQNTVNNIIPQQISITEHSNNNPRQNKQYLISQFFTIINSSSTRRNNPQAPANINTNLSEHTTYDTPIPFNNNIITNNHPTTTQTETEPTTRNNSPNTPHSHHKHYIQRTISKKPIPNDYWGSSMDSNNPHCFRIYFQNINGLTAGKSMTRWLETVTTMKEKHCEIFGLAETNTNWNSNNIKNNINLIINNQYTNSSTILSSNRYNPTNQKRLLPGGTLQSCRGHWKSRCISTISDSRNMGRWTGQQFQLKSDKTLTIITDYRPCKPNTTTNIPTSATTYRQQTIMLTEEDFSNPDPRKLFIEDMIHVTSDLYKTNNNYIPF